MRCFAIILVSVVLLSSCGEIEEPESKPPTMEEQLREVMKMPLATGTGKMVRSISYCCIPQKPFSILDFYYPVKGNISYRVQTDPQGDTLEISMQYYKGEKLQSSHSFRYRSGMLPEWLNTAEYIYDSEEKLVERYHTDAGKSRHLTATYRYDDKGRLTSIETSAGNETASQMYSYDQEGRIAQEWSTIKTEEQVETDFMFYRYEGELLVAKEASAYGKSEGLRQDWYRYVYDQQGRLTAQSEFDPWSFFQRKNYAEFFYD